MEEDSQLISAEEVANIYREHGDSIHRFLVGVLRDAALAADCLQTTFAKLLQKGHTTQPATRKSWLYAVAYQEAMLARRRGGTTDRVLRKVAWRRESDGTATTPPPEETLLRLEVTQRVQQTLEQLPPEQRQIVRMRIYEEKTFAEIAAELNIPLGTALGRMRTALIKLKPLLSEP
jgi:RNA polymerase sigma-70 factor (ECF subfamily)